MPGFTDNDLEALSRVIQSEVGSSGSHEERIAVGWVARNRARKRGVTLAKFALPPAKQGKGRPMSSARPGTEESKAAAFAVLSSQDDPTHGAYAAFEPALQDKLFMERRKGYSMDAGMVRAKWLREMSYFGTVGAWDLFGAKGGAGAMPTPPGFATVAPGRSSGARGSGRAAGSGGFPWLLLLLLGLASKRR